MTRWGLISASASVLLLTGCMVGPKYTKPDTPLAPAFKEISEPQAGDGWKVAQPSDGVLRKKWWETYDDAKLNELENEVEPANQTVKIAETNFRQAGLRFVSIAPRRRPRSEPRPVLRLFEPRQTNPTFRTISRTVAQGTSPYHLICLTRSICGDESVAR